MKVTDAEVKNAVAYGYLHSSGEDGVVLRLLDGREISAWADGVVYDNASLGERGDGHPGAHCSNPDELQKAIRWFLTHRP